MKFGARHFKVCRQPDLTNCTRVVLGAGLDLMTEGNRKSGAQRPASAPKADRRLPLVKAGGLFLVMEIVRDDNVVCSTMILDEQGAEVLT